MRSLAMVKIPISVAQLAKFIEHSRLQPQTTNAEIAKLCEEARKFGFYGVVVNANKTSQASALLASSGVRVVTTVSFPFGCSKLETKTKETMLAIDDGTNEIDMVADLGQLVSGNYEFLHHEVSALSKITRNSGVALKVIIETSLLTPQGIAEAAKVIEEAGADFVKTNTGFGTRGVSVEDVRTILGSTKGRIGIKAAGRINDAKAAIQLIRAGATRIGTSHGPHIIESYRSLSPVV
jgi:deoxyribose-phosphate aldolase